MATPAQFQITGPETEVNRVVAAVAQVDLTDLNSDFNRSVVYTLVDENSEPVESANISSTVGNSVSVSIPVYPIRELPITFGVLDHGAAQGRLLSGKYRNRAHNGACGRAAVCSGRADRHSGFHH